jgi:NRPS condensation-like uncharacterized protein
MSPLKGSSTSKKNPTKTSPDEETIRMNVNIPRSFYKRIKQTALDENTTVTDIVMKALEGYLSK